MTTRILSTLGVCALLLGTVACDSGDKGERADDHKVEVKADDKTNGSVAFSSSVMDASTGLTSTSIGFSLLFLCSTSCSAFCC